MKESFVYNLDHCPDIDRQERRILLGGKGAGLVEMTRMGLPVPPGFILTTQVCTAFYTNHKKYPQELREQVDHALQTVQNKLCLRWGDPHKPLLLSVRSGARSSMPGMMDTVLNLGLNDKTVEGLKNQSQDPRFAYDSYRRFIQMYSHVVLGMSLRSFEDILTQYKAVRKTTSDAALSAEDLVEIIAAYQLKVQHMTGRPFPQDVNTQLWGAIEAVLCSWTNDRAQAYRRLFHIPESGGTAVVVQAMVFGNRGEDSATGVAFTRDPSTGEKVFYGEYLLNAQGEDVVAGIRTPEPLGEHQKQFPQQQSLEVVMPAVYQELVHLKNILEEHYKDMQDIEFTVQEGKLWLLQTRNGKRTTPAALRIAVEMVNEGLISREEALGRFDPVTLDQLLHPCLPPTSTLKRVGQGLPASPGAAVGRIALTADECTLRTSKGEEVILVREETSAEDIHGMAVAQGILTSRGGMTSHAAVVARGMGRPCVTGVSNMHIHMEGKKLSLGSVCLPAGAYITVNGTTGEIFQGKSRLEAPRPSQDFTTFMHWADQTRRMQVRANAETPTDAKKALQFGAQGIGLCRTEHMFFDTERISTVREMILAAEPKTRQKILLKMLPIQRQDFFELFQVVGTLPITVRLLDPPLHEFLPHSDIEVDQLGRALHLSTDVIRKRIKELNETNPMLGHRGCRLGVTYPEIYAIQVQALFEAAALFKKEYEHDINLEIMIPLISLTGELRFLKEVIANQAMRTQNETQQILPYKLGTMIELPRAALKAGKIASLVDFLSFGTNDLTQTTFGFSRDDTGSFFDIYRHKGILERDPFVSLDQSGVGELIRMACQSARSAKPEIKLGVCGEHGGDPLSIYFFEAIGLDYVSCSPYRVPIARLAAAQAALKKS